jgi:hypothetical protein
MDLAWFSQQHQQQSGLDQQKITNMVAILK